MVRGSIRGRHSIRVRRRSHRENPGVREANFLVSAMRPLRRPQSTATLSSCRARRAPRERLNGPRRRSDAYALLHGDGDHQCGPSSGRRIDLHRSSQRRDLIAGASQSESAFVQPGRDRERIETHTVIVDGAEKDPSRLGDADADLRRVGMLADVGQRLLDNAINSRCDHRRQAVDRGVDGYPDSAPLRETVGQELERSRKTEIVQDPRPQFVRQAPELLLDPVQMGIDVAQALPHRGGQIVSDFREHHVRGGEQLARLVVKRLGNPLRLALEAVVQTPKRRFALDLIHRSIHGRDEITDACGGRIKSGLSIARSVLVVYLKRLDGGNRAAGRIGSIEGTLRTASSLTGFPSASTELIATKWTAWSGSIVHLSHFVSTTFLSEPVLGSFQRTSSTK